MVHDERIKDKNRRPELALEGKVIKPDEAHPVFYLTSNRNE